MTVQQLESLVKPYFEGLPYLKNIWVTNTFDRNDDRLLVSVWVDEIKHPMDQPFGLLYRGAATRLRLDYPDFDKVAWGIRIIGHDLFSVTYL